MISTETDVKRAKTFKATVYSVKISERVLRELFDTLLNKKDDALNVIIAEKMKFKSSNKTQDAKDIAEGLGVYNEDFIELKKAVLAYVNLFEQKDVRTIADVDQKLLDIKDHQAIAKFVAIGLLFIDDRGRVKLN
jgi:ribosomal protein L4